MQYECAYKRAFGLRLHAAGFASLQLVSACWRDLKSHASGARVIGRARAVVLSIEAHAGTASGRVRIQSLPLALTEEMAIGRYGSTRCPRPQPGWSFSLGSPVSGVGSVPSAFMTNTCRIPSAVGSMSCSNAIVWPSGDQSGSWSRP